MAAVEFALIAPLFLVLALATWELGTAVTASNNLTAALREGGRLASMDYAPLLEPNQTGNQKVIQDVKAFLSAAGIPGASTTVTIKHAEGANVGTTFDLDNEDNYMQLFKIEATVPYSAISLFPNRFLNGQSLRASVVFRRGRSSASG